MKILKNNPYLCAGPPKLMVKKNKVNSTVIHMTQLMNQRLMKQNNRCVYEKYKYFKLFNK